MTATTPKAIVPKLIYEGSSHVLNGASKAGKSTLATQLAMCVAAGQPFLGMDTARQRVLLLSLEMSAGLVRDRIRGIARDTDLPMPEPEWFHVVAPVEGDTPRIDLTTPEGAALLRRLVEESGAKLVVLDTLYRFLPGTDFSDNGEMGEVMGTINAVANDTGAALLVIHHTSKGTHEGPVSQSGLGAQIIGGAANVVAMLRRVTREPPGRWELNVESHYEAPEEAIFYQRPSRGDGNAGAGCERCTEADARGLTEDSVRALFEGYGGG